MEKLSVGVTAGDIEPQIAKLEKSIKSVRHFVSGKVNNYAKVEGVKELKGKLPFEHQDHFYDIKGRVIKLEKYERDFSKPTRRYYFYEGNEDHIAESVWFSRRDLVDNLHRYQVDPVTKLMMERSEYDKNGALFYSIRSMYDASNPPNLIEEAWHLPGGTPVKRYRYRYDKNGELAVEEHYDQGNKLVGFFMLTYDAKGNPIRKEWHNDKRLLMSAFDYTYDSKDRVVKVALRNQTGRIAGSQLFSYDMVGNVVEEKWYDSENGLTKHLRY